MNNDLDKKKNSIDLKKPFPVGPGAISVEFLSAV